MSGRVTWVPDPEVGYGLAAEAAEAWAAADRVFAAGQGGGWASQPVGPMPEALPESSDPPAVGERLAALAATGMKVVRLFRRFEQALAEAQAAARAGAAVTVLPGVGPREQALAAGVAREAAAWIWDGEAVAMLPALRPLGMVMQQPLADLGGFLAGRGAAPAEPVAVLTEPGRPWRRWQMGTVGQWAGRSVAAGAVVWLGPRAEASATLPLAGQAIWFAGDAEHRPALAPLEEAGARVVVAPTIRLLERRDGEDIQAALRGLAGYAAVLFTSRAAVEAWFSILKHHGRDLREMTAPVAVVGAATAAALWRHGLIARWQAPAGAENQEGLWSVLEGEAWSGRRVLWPSGQLKREYLAERLEAAGAQVVAPVVYRNVAQPVGVALRRALAEGAWAMVLCTAASTVEGLCRALSPEELAALRKTAVGAIGPKTRQALEAWGVPVAVVPETASVDALARAAVDYLLRSRAGVG